MKGNLKSVLTLLILLLFFCSCGMGNIPNEVFNTEQVMKEESVTIESVAEEPEDMPAIVFMLQVKYYGHKEINEPHRLLSFFDNQGNLYFLKNACVNGLTWMEVYDEFAEGKLDDVLLLNTTCEMNELHENYKLLKGVSQNEEFELIPDRDYCLDVEVNEYIWLGFYYREDETLSYVEIREEGTYGAGITCLPSDERANQIYEWLASVSEEWK